MLAEGKSSVEWASANGVAERTAQRWASEPAVRAEVDSFRRGALVVAHGGGAVDPAVSQGPVEDWLDVPDKGDLARLIGEAGQNAALDGEVEEQVIKRDEVGDAGRGRIARLTGCNA